MMFSSFFDTVIFKNAFKRSLKSVSFIVVSSLLIVANIAICAALVKNDGLFIYWLVAFFILAVMNFMIYDITNLNLIFISDNELGINNLEIRKGRSSGSMFFSRLIANKIVSFSIIFIHYFVFLITCAVKNSHFLPSFSLIIFLFMILDLIITGVLLFLFSFKKMKLAIAFSCITGIFILMTPLVMPTAAYEMINPKSKQNLQLDLTRSNTARNEILELDHEGNFFAHKLLEDGYQLNAIYKKSDPTITYYSSAQALYSGVFDVDDISKIDLNYSMSDEVKNNWLITNNDFIVENSKDLDLSTNYEKSIYNKADFNENKYLFTVKEFKKTISQIRKTIDEDKIKDFDKFSNLVYNFGVNLIHYERGSNPVINKDVLNTFFIQSFDNHTVSYELEIGNIELNTPVGLRLWNQSVSQLIIAGLNYESFGSEEFKRSNVDVYNFLFPWAMTLEIINNSNPFINDFAVINNAANELNSASTYIIANGGKFINQGKDENDEFKEIPKFNPVAGSKVSNSNKLFSKVAYQLVLLLISLWMIFAAYFIFNKKLKI